MRSKLVATIVVVGLALAALGCNSHHVTTKTDVASVEKDIREHLPNGSSRAQVSTYLDERKIGHSHVGELKNNPEHSYTEMALIRDVSEGRMVKSAIQILFKFDTTDSRLVSYSVREIFTGP